MIMAKRPSLPHGTTSGRATVAIAAAPHATAAISPLVQTFSWRPRREEELSARPSRVSIALLIDEELTRED
jgi:hypothetical protein